MTKENLSLAVVEERDAKTLASLNKARLALAEAKTIFDALKIKDLAEAARVYAKAAKLSQESVNAASEIAILAARRAGEILAQLPRASAGRHSKIPAEAAAISIYKKTLIETKTPARTATTWQQVASVPEKDTKAYFAEKKEAGKDFSTAGLLRFAKVGQDKEKPAFSRQDRQDRAFKHLQSIYDVVEPADREREISMLFIRFLTYYKVLPEVVQCLTKQISVG